MSTTIVAPAFSLTDHAAFAAWCRAMRPHGVCWTRDAVTTDAEGAEEMLNVFLRGDPGRVRWSILRIPGGVALEDYREPMGATPYASLADALAGIATELDDGDPE